jgi:translation initiation factor 2 beta subunit (eIF-2beta)/eIF-5
MINIAHSLATDDPFYRYKRSKVQLENKTFKNFQTICKELKTSDQPFRSFISKILGCRMDQKNVLSSQVTVAQLESVVQKFIEQYVLCTSCKLPELDSNGNCQACGKRKHK